MENYYFFSQNKICFKDNNKKYLLTNHTAIHIEDYHSGNIIFFEEYGDMVNSYIINPTITNHSINLPNIRKTKIDNDIFYEIIHLSNNAPLGFFETENSKIFIFKNHANIYFENQNFCYYFYAHKNTCAIEQDNKIFLLNEKCVLEFDTKNYAFCLKKCKKTQKNDEKIDFLCKTPQNNTYFLLYSLDTKNQNINLKQYKNNNQLVLNDYCLPIIFFHLCKSNFDDAKQLLDSKIDFGMIKNYLHKFDNLLEINGDYFLTSTKESCKINFLCKNNIIYEID